MILEHYYWYFDSVIKPEICNKIVEMGISLKERHAGEVGGFENPIVHSVRDSKVGWFTDRWMYELLQPFVDIANVESGWNFEWDWSEEIQFTEYFPNQHYDWHSDQNSKPYDSNNHSGFVGKYRKLSTIVSLTDHRDYIGGDLQFDYGGGDIRTCYEIKPKGSVIVFPSFVRHRVTPIYRGIRHSLVMWNLGKPYK